MTSCFAMTLLFWVWGGKIICFLVWELVYYEYSNFSQPKTSKFSGIFSNSGQIAKIRAAGVDNYVTTCYNLVTSIRR